MRRFSKGMRKQAAFQLALSIRPEVLILDEPVDGLDPVMRRQVWSLMLSDVAQRGTTVLVSSHNLRELEDVCDHVGIMDHGKMLLERSLADMQGSTVKLQIVGEPPRDLDILLQAKKMGMSDKAIARFTGSDESSIRALRAELQQWFVRWADPALDGGREPVTGMGQLCRAGIYAEGREVDWESDLYKNTVRK